jgi:hypothetical protein
VAGVAISACAEIRVYVVDQEVAAVEDVVDVRSDDRYRRQLENVARGGPAFGGSREEDRSC